MRLRTLLPVLLAACGGGGGGDDEPTPDAKPPGFEIGFNKPEGALRANVENDDGDFIDDGPADLSCLNTPSADEATTVPVTLTTVVRDFQSDNLVPNAGVVAFRNQDTTDVFDTTTSGENAEVTITIPIGVTRFGYIMTDPNSLDTLLLNQKVEPDNPTQTEGSIRSVSKGTANTLPALIGVSRTPDTGVLAGAMRDCQDREISGFIATVAKSEGITEGTHAEILAQVETNRVDGADAYYFRSVAGDSLPVKHTQEAASTGNGLFMVIELAEASTAVVQIWGYLNDADLAADKMTLIGQLVTESKPETVITGSYEPIRN